MLQLNSEQGPEVCDATGADGSAKLITKTTNTKR